MNVKFIDEKYKKFWEELIAYFPFTVISVSDTTRLYTRFKLVKN
jgi:hypothetical protein